MDEELKACPFCGGEPNLTHSDYVHDDLRPMPVVECKSCSAWVRAEDWNTRAQQPSQDSEAVAWLDPVRGLDWLVDRMSVAPGTKLYTHPAASVPAGCKVVPVELLSGVLEYCDQLLGELNHLYNYAGSTGDDIQHDDADYAQLRALLASAEGVKNG